MLLIKYFSFLTDDLVSFGAANFVGEVVAFVPKIVELGMLGVVHFG